jgi:hypothetical protein
MPPFIPGIELSRRFYAEAVRPILDAHEPGLPHAAARIGWGSDVLGFDTEMSTDHGWGPTVRIFLRDEDAGQAGPIHELLREHLPHEFYGYPVSTVPAPGEPGTLLMHPTTEGPVEHLVTTATVRAFCRERLAYDIDQPIEAPDWLTFPSQRLREITAGAVHHDGVGELTRLRERLAWYPHDVWLYLLAAGWARIGQEEHLMPRAGYVGDELGSALIGSRLVRDIMSLCFLMERQYAPYPKWFGTAFKRLPCAADLAPSLWRAQRAETWPEREAALCAAYASLARAHNALGITEPLPEAASVFHGRPFQVIHGDVFADAICAQIADPEVRRIASQLLIGGIDQFSDSTDMHEDMSRRAVLRKLYTETP